MANWRLAKSLETLRQQINELAPDRSKVSDGTIGDRRHSQRTSDHNPWIRDAREQKGIVTALDITHDPEHGVDGAALAAVLTLDRRVKYLIHGGRIWKSRTGRTEDYRGTNPHDTHVHVSVQPHPDYYDNDEAWRLIIGSTGEHTVLTPTLRRGDEGLSVRVLQSKLAIPVDGIFGPRTEQAVKQFQQEHSLDVDGIVGRNTWFVLLEQK